MMKRILGSAAQTKGMAAIKRSMPLRYASRDTQTMVTIYSVVSFWPASRGCMGQTDAVSAFCLTWVGREACRNDGVRDDVYQIGIQSRSQDRVLFPGASLSSSCMPEEIEKDRAPCMTDTDDAFDVAQHALEHLVASHFAPSASSETEQRVVGEHTSSAGLEIARMHERFQTHGRQSLMRVHDLYSLAKKYRPDQRKACKQVGDGGSSVEEGQGRHWDVVDFETCRQMSYPASVAVLVRNDHDLRRRLSQYFCTRRPMASADRPCGRAGSASATTCKCAIRRRRSLGKSSRTPWRCGAAAIVKPSAPYHHPASTSLPAVSLPRSQRTRDVLAANGRDAESSRRRRRGEKCCGSRQLEDSSLEPLQRLLRSTTTPPRPSLQERTETLQGIGTANGSTS